MSTTRLTDTRLLVLSIVLSGGIFAVDLSLPLGVASGVPYPAYCISRVMELLRVLVLWFG